jgi:hypothetical protein
MYHQLIGIVAIGHWYKNGIIDRDFKGKRGNRKRKYKGAVVPGKQRIQAKTESLALDAQKIGDIVATNRWKRESA